MTARTMDRSTDVGISLGAWLSGTALAMLLTPQFVTFLTVVLTACASLAGYVVKPWAEQYFDRKRQAERRELARLRRQVRELRERNEEKT